MLDHPVDCVRVLGNRAFRARATPRRPTQNAFTDICMARVVCRFAAANTPRNPFFTDRDQHGWSVYSTPTTTTSTSTPLTTKTTTTTGTTATKPPLIHDRTYQAWLSDGSAVTYRWYLFSEQPALQCVRDEWPAKRMQRLQRSCSFLTFFLFFTRIDTHMGCVYYT